MTTVIRSNGKQERFKMPARAKYNTRRISVRLDAECQWSLQQVMKATGLSESKVIRQLIIDAAVSLPYFPPRDKSTKP